VVPGSIPLPPPTDRKGGVKRRESLPSTASYFRNGENVGGKGEGRCGRSGSLRRQDNADVVRLVHSLVPEEELAHDLTAPVGAADR